MTRPPPLPQPEDLGIGEVAALLGLNVDTLRYYEKLGLLARPPRTAGGRRRYGARELSRLRFILRARQMRFTLAEIGQLLALRDDPQRVRDGVRALAAGKLDEVEARLADLTLLRNELRLLLNLCRGSRNGCPIIAAMDDDAGPAQERKPHDE